MVAFAYVATSDAGLGLSASVAIRRALDSRDARLFRPAHPIARLRRHSVIENYCTIDCDWRFLLLQTSDPGEW